VTPRPPQVEPPKPAVSDLLTAAGLEGDFVLDPLPGGANNRVFRVEVGGRSALLKLYFRHPADPRDRLRAEFCFIRFAWDRGVRVVPEPLACDPANQLALYELVQGRQPRQEDVTPRQLTAALSFIGDLNRHKMHADAADLPMASEACLSIRQHLECVGRRLDGLSRLEPSTDIDRDASRFVRDELTPAWNAVAGAVRRRAESQKLTLDGRLSRAEQCLSPSDFGFHNALVRPDGETCFLDFEYAGWDDPAKLVCDFFSQVQVPVPMEHFDGFLDSIVAGLPHSQEHRSRSRLLLPVYRLKWCCILLNEFLPTAARRRCFSRPGGDWPGRKAEQLHKARRALAQAAGSPAFSRHRFPNS